jgi:hypothetical protein
MAGYAGHLVLLGWARNWDKTQQKWAYIILV